MSSSCLQLVHLSMEHVKLSFIFYVNNKDIILLFLYAQVKFHCLIQGFRLIQFLLSNVHRVLCMHKEHYSVVQILVLRNW